MIPEDVVEGLRPEFADDYQPAVVEPPSRPRKKATSAPPETPSQDFNGVGPPADGP
jgi:hypothetical protein